MKKVLKELIPSIMIAFVASFMMYMYEPLVTYASNVNDFWFDLGMVAPDFAMFFVLSFFIITGLYGLIYTICCVLKKKNIYKWIVAISFVCLVFLYIQGNFMVGNLPKLDGTTIEWNKYTVENIISILVFVIILTVEIVAIKKTKINKVLKVNCFLGGAIFFMLSTSLINILANQNIYKEKVISVSTERNMNKISSNKNFLIFLADAVDSVEFASNVDGEAIFEDFTYYPDTVSGYTYTRDSIPFIFSGVWNKNETEFSEYSTKAFNESAILNKLEKENFNLNIYDSDIVWNSRKATDISNIDLYNDKINSCQLFKELTKYSLYKYLPFFVKRYSKIETMNFDNCKVEKDEKIFDWKNPIVYENINNNDLEKIDQNYFQFIHIEGGHVPFDNDEDVNTIPVEEGTYIRKLKATAKIINSYIQRLKDNNAYDNSVIVILADHGYWASNGNDRQNPFLYIKGIDEHHKLNVSDVPVSYEDLSEAFVELSNGYKSDELFKNIDTNRVRKFLYNGSGIEDSMEEYEQRGKAYDKSARFKTGVKYER